MTHSFLRTDGPAVSSFCCRQTACYLTRRGYSTPVALENESGPGVWIAVAWIAAQRQLGFAQGRRRRQTVSPQRTVEPLHQLRCGAVLHAPEACHHPRHAGIEEAARESHDALAAHRLAERGLACGWHY